MITKQELVDGIRFAGRRAAAAGANAKDWNHQLAHQWTTRDAFSHLAATAGGAAGLYPLLDAGVLSGMGADRIAQGNASAIDKMKDQTKGRDPRSHRCRARGFGGFRGNAGRSRPEQGRNSRRIRDGEG